MQAIVYILIFASIAFIIVEMTTVVADFVGKIKVKEKLKNILPDNTNELNHEQYQKILGIFEKIGINDVDHSQQLESTLKTLKKFQSSAGSQ